MKISVTKEMFVEAFKKANRETQFSEEAKEAIYDYLIEMEETSEVEPELDVIDICCSFSEVSLSDDAELKAYSRCEPVIVLSKSLVFSD